MELLQKREKDQEEADLENCFNQLKGQTNDEKRLNQLTDQSIRDLVDMKDNISEYSLPDKKSDTQQSFYKPMLASAQKSDRKMAPSGQG